MNITLSSTVCAEEYDPVWLLVVIVFSLLSAVVASCTRLRRNKIPSNDSIAFKHPFTAIVAGTTSCGKTRFVFRLIEHASRMIDHHLTK